MPEYSSKEIEAIMEDKIALCCSYNIFTDSILKKDSIVLPYSSGIDLRLRIWLNHSQIASGGEMQDQRWRDALQAGLAASNFWSQLDYEVEFDLKDTSELTIKLRCNIFNAEKQRILENSNNSQFDTDTDIIHLSKLTCAVELFSVDNSNNIKPVIDSMNFCFASILLQLDSQLPLCFSYNVRRLFKTNFPYMRSISRTLSNDQDRLMASLLSLLNSHGNEEVAKWSLISKLSLNSTKKSEQFQFCELIEFNELLEVLSTHAPL